MTKGKYTKRTFDSYEEVRKFTLRGRAKPCSRAFGAGCRLHLINKDAANEHIELMRDDAHVATITPDSIITIHTHAIGTMLDRAFGIGSRMFRGQRVILLNDELRNTRRTTWLPNNLQIKEIGSIVSRYYTGFQIDLVSYSFVQPRKLAKRQTDKVKSLEWKRALAKARKQTVVLANLSEFIKEVHKAKTLQGDYETLSNSWPTLRADMFYEAVTSGDYMTLVRMVAHQVAAHSWLYRDDQLNPHEMRKVFDLVYSSIRTEVRELAGAVKLEDEDSGRNTELPDTQPEA